MPVAISVAKGGGGAVARSFAGLAFRLCVVFTLTVSALAVSPGAAGAAPGHQSGAAHVTWRFQGPGDDFWNVDQVLWLTQKAPHTYWAMQFRFTGSNDPGYLGLQTNGRRLDGSEGETILFSLWNATGARGRSCGRFGGEGVGYSCRLPLAIATGKAYRLRVWRLEADGGGQWWGGWISDGDRDHHLGDIRVPAAGHQRFGQVLSFAEYFGPAVPCDRVPRSIVQLTQPAANRRNQAYDYYSSFAAFSKLSCAGGRGTPANYGWTQGVELILGGAGDGGR